jgi:hypothetical protein
MMKLFSTKKKICLLGMLCTVLCFAVFYQTVISTVAAWSFQLYATSQWGKPFSYKEAYLKESMLVIVEPNYDNHLSFSARSLILDFNFNWSQYRLDIAVEVDEPRFRLLSPLNPQRELKDFFSQDRKWFRAHPRFHVQKGLLSWCLTDQIKRQISFDFDGGSDDGGVLTLYFDPENVEANYLQILAARSAEGKKIRYRSVQTSFQSLSSFIELFGFHPESLSVDSGILDGEVAAVFPKKGRPYLEANLSFDDIVCRYSSERSTFRGVLPQIQLNLRHNPSYRHLVEIDHLDCAKAPELNDRKSPNINSIWGDLRSFNPGSFRASPDGQFQLDAGIAEQNRDLRFPVIGELELVSHGTMTLSSNSQNWQLEEIAGLIKLDEDETIHIDLSANHREEEVNKRWVLEGLANLSNYSSMHFDGFLRCSHSPSFESQSHFHLHQLSDGVKHLDIKLHKLNPIESKFLQTIFAHFYPVLNEFSIAKGMIDAHIEADFKESYRDHTLNFTYELKNLFFENDDLWVEMKEGEGSSADARQGFHEIDMTTYSNHGTLPIFHGSYLIKSNGLLFEEVHGLVNFEENTISIEPLEGYCLETYFSGGLAFDYKDPAPGVFNLSIHLPTLSGKLSQIQRFFEYFHQGSLFNQIPFESIVTARNKGITLDFSFLPEDYTLQADIQGSIVDGYSSFENSDISLKGVYADFDYQHRNETLEFTDIQGTLLVGKPRRVEEYLFVGDHLRFEHLNDPDVYLDVAVQDGNDELLRIAGRSSDADTTGLKRLHLNPGFTHFSCIYPQEWQCTFKNWSSIETLHFLSRFDLQTLIKDLHRFRCPGFLFLTPALLEQLSKESLIDGEGTMILGYEPLDHHFSYHLEAVRSGNKYESKPFAKLSGRKLEKKWLVDQLQWNDWTAYAELQHEADKWKIPFLGLNGGEDFLIGLEGEFLPDEGLLYAKLNLCKIDLSGLRRWECLNDFVDRWIPEGHLRMSGQMECNLSKGNFTDGFAGHFQAETAGLSIKGSPIVLGAPFQFDVKHDESNLTFHMNLQPGLYKFNTHEFDISNFNLLIADGEMNFSLQTEDQRHPFSVKGSVPWPSCHPMTLTLVDNSVGYLQSYFQPLQIIWGKNQQGNFSIQSLRGAFGGCLFNLKEDKDVLVIGERGEPSRRCTSLVGDISVDFHRLTPLLNPSTAEIIQNLQIESIYTFKGRLSLVEEMTASFLDSIYFNGELSCEKPIIRGVQFETLQGQFQYRPQRFDLQDLKIDDAACRIHVDTLSVMRDSVSPDWRFFIPNIHVKNLRPSAVREVESDHVLESAKWQSLVVKRFELTDFSGDCHNVASWQGKGNMHFINPVKKNFNHPLFAIPAEIVMRLGLDPKVMNPVTGTIYFDLRGDRFYLNRFKDVYSEGRGSKFILAEGNTSWMDFDGNLFVRIKMKQYNLFFKITELFTVLVQGNIKKPQYQLLQGDRLPSRKWGKKSSQYASE